MGQQELAAFTQPNCARPLETQEASISDGVKPSVEVSGMQDKNGAYFALGSCCESL